MKLPRIVDTEIPDHWTERNHTLRAALDCFAPLAITIRARPNGGDLNGAFQPSPRQAIR